MKFEIITEYPDPTLEQKWFDFLPNSTYPSHYTSPGFFKMPYWENQNPFAVLVLDGQKVVGVSCGLNQNDQINSGIEVRPQVSFARDSDEGEIAKTMFEGLLRLGGETGEFITLHSLSKIDAFEELGFKTKKAEGSFEVVLLDLAAGSEEIFKNFSQSRRSDLRKVMRQDKVRVTQVETLEELAELHEIHIDWCKVKEVEPDTWEQFEIAWKQKDYKRIFIAKTEGKIIAGSYFRFYKGGLVEYAANNSIPEYRNLRPNDLLVWKAIEWSCENGFSHFSMGGSHLFLRRFGGNMVASYRYQFDRTLFKKHAVKEALSGMAIRTYQNLPDSTRQKIKRVLGRQ
jgi:hypothetical protein